MEDPDVLIDDDEIILRRIPVSMDWCDGQSVEPEAFGPRKEEVSGISLSREKMKSVEEVGKGMSKSGYYVCRLSVARIRELGLTVVFAPNTAAGYDPSHVEISELNGNVRKEMTCLEAMERLARDVTPSMIHGPFSGNTDHG